MHKYLLIFIVFLTASRVMAQAENLEIVSFYPASAFVSNRLLPFTVTGAEGVRVTRVELQGGEGCKSLIDPFYRHIFHVYCTKPELVDVAVTVEIDLDPFDYILTFNNMSVAERRLPASELNSVSREEGTN